MSVYMKIGIIITNVYSAVVIWFAIKFVCELVSLIYK